MEQTNPILSREQVAELLGVTVWQVRRLVDAGLPCLHAGRRVRFHRQQVLDWWASGHTPERPVELTELNVVEQSITADTLARLLAGKIMDREFVEVEITVRLKGGK